MRSPGEPPTIKSLLTRRRVAAKPVVVSCQVRSRKFRAGWVVFDLVMAPLGETPERPTEYAHFAASVSCDKIQEHNNTNK